MRSFFTAALVFGMVGCTGDNTPEASPQLDAALHADKGLLAASWMMKTASPDGLAPFSKEGWFALVTRQDIPETVRLLGPEGGLVGARAHAEAAAMYRQAAVTSAQAIMQTYHETPQEGDPPGMAHLVAVSAAILGNSDANTAARAALASTPDSAVASWHTVWDGSSWPPPDQGLPLEFPEKSGGTWPGVGDLPHFELVEATEEGRKVAMADPTALVAQALWHDTVATSLAGEQAALLDTWDLRYLMPAEAPTAPSGAMPLELIFGSELLHENDGDFLAAVRQDGLVVVPDWQGKSLMADLTARSLVDGKVDTEKARDVAQALRADLLEQMEATAGSPQDYHRNFADLARVGALRNLAWVARASGDSYSEGVLRLSALDFSSTPATSAPSWLLSMCAYDAANRYPLRATEILHNLISRVPDLASARYGLDVLALRVSRESGGGRLPGM